MGLFNVRFLQQGVCVGVLGALAACGGGGGSSDTPPSTPSSSAVSSSLASSSTSSAEAVSSSSVSNEVSSSSSSAEQATSSSSSQLPEDRALTHALWSFKANAKVRSSAVMTDRLVIFGTEAGRLYALDRQTGAEQWSLDAGGAISTELLLADGKVIFLTFGGKVLAVNAATGAQVWSVATGAEFYRGYGYHLASALLVGERVYIGTSSGKIYGLALATGAEEWSMDIKSAVHTKPVVVGDNLYVSSDTAVHALSIASKTQLWSTYLQMPASPAVAGNTLVVGSRGCFVHALDTANGAERWKLSHGSDWVTGGAVILDGIAYIGSSDDKKFQAIELATGALKWEIWMGANVYSTPAFVDDVAYVSSGDAYGSPGRGMVRAVDKTGQILWSVSGKNFFSNPIVAEDKLFIGSDDGYFYAFPAR